MEDALLVAPPGQNNDRGRAMPDSHGWAHREPSEEAYKKIPKREDGSHSRYTIGPEGHRQHSMNAPYDRHSTNSEEGTSTRKAEWEVGFTEECRGWPRTQDPRPANE